MAQTHTPSSTTTALELGYYKHYKGPIYQVIGVALDTERNEAVVLYHACYPTPELTTDYGKNPIFARPLSMFTEHIEHNNARVPRFNYLGKSQPPIGYC